jgi:hypothetical protein
MDAETRRIWEMIGALSDAFWHRVAEPGVSILDAMNENAKQYRPVSAEEIAIWTELTAPHNYASVCRYIANAKRRDITEYAAQLYETILAEATRRWESAFPGSPPPTSSP